MGYASQAGLRLVQACLILLLWPALAAADENRVTDFSEQLTFCINQQFAEYSTPSLYTKLNLQEVCPLLVEYLEAQTPADQLHDENRDFLTAIALQTSSTNLAEMMDLSYFISKYQPKLNDHGQYPFNLSELSEILAATLDLQTREAHISWWQRFINWLNSKRSTDNEELDLGWLEDMLNKFSMSEATAKVILYTSTLFIVLLTLLLVFREIYLSKKSGQSFLHWRRKRSYIKSAEASRAAEDGGIIPVILPTNLPELLDVCIDYLIAGHRLPARKSQTNYEFLRYLESSDDMAAGPFSMVFKHAERDIYGGYTPEDSVLERCFDAARQLFTLHKNALETKPEITLSMRAS